MPWVGSRYDTFLGTQIAIYALFALSLNLLLGTTGLVSFGHAAYFGIGSYACGILMKTYGVPFSRSPYRPRRWAPPAFALVFGFFCVRLTKIYFAMLTLAFSQIVWAICFKWNDVTGGDQGLPRRTLSGSRLDVGDSRPRRPAHRRAVLPAHPRGGDGVARGDAADHRLAVRPHADDDPREPGARRLHRRQRARATSSPPSSSPAASPGSPAALFGIFNRGVFADFVFWSKSADVMIMTILGGMHHFWGPAVGAATLVLTLLNQQITAYTEYWPFVLGTILIVLLFVFPGGILGGLCRPRVADAAREAAPMLEVRGLAQVVRRLPRRRPMSAWRSATRDRRRSSGRTARASRRCST